MHDQRQTAPRCWPAGARRRRRPPGAAARALVRLDLRVGRMRDRSGSPRVAGRGPASQRGLAERSRAAGSFTELTSLLRSCSRVYSALVCAYPPCFCTERRQRVRYVPNVCIPAQQPPSAPWDTLRMTRLTALPARAQMTSRERPAAAPSWWAGPAYPLVPPGPVRGAGRWMPVVATPTRQCRAATATERRSRLHGVNPRRAAPDPQGPARRWSMPGVPGVDERGDRTRPGIARSVPTAVCPGTTAARRPAPLRRTERGS
jgi:hypothetical protein